MKEQIRILIVQDPKDDVQLILNPIQQEGFDLSYKRVDSADPMERALDRENWDLVITDYSVTGLRALDALKLVQKRGLDLSCIIVSDVEGEEIAVETMKAGADYYLMKKNLSQIGSILKRELKREGQNASHKRLVEELKRYKILFDNISDLAYICDTKGNIVFVNRIFEKLSGYKPEEFFGKSFAPLFDEENLKKAVHFYRMTINGERPQYELTFKDTGIPCEYKNIPLYDEKHTIIGVLGTARNITERKRAEHNLKVRKLQQSVISTIGQIALSADTTLSHLFEQCVIYASETLDVDYSKIMELLPSRDSLLLRAGVGWRKGAVGNATVALKSNTFPYNALYSGEPVVLKDFWAETIYDDTKLFRDHGVVSGISVTISGIDKPLGIFGVFTTKRREFAQEDINFLQAIANIISEKMKNYKLEEEIKVLNQSLEERVKQRTSELVQTNNVLLKEINIRKLMEDALLESEEKYRQVVSTTKDAVMIFDNETKRFVEVNKACEEIYGYSRKEFLNLRHNDITEETNISNDSIRKLVAGEQNYISLHYHRKKDGTVFPVEISRSTFMYKSKIMVCGIIRDITERKRMEEKLKMFNEFLERRVADRTLEIATANNELEIEIEVRKRAEEKIKYLAFYDHLTGLPNRVLFHDRITFALSHAHRNNEMLAVLFLDLDRFKVVNDTLGHSVGDKLLINIADRLKNCIRKDDTIARFGGDEFIILLPGIHHVEDINHVISKIHKSFQNPWVVSDNKFYITTSIGITLYPNDGNNVESLLKNSDIAMYRAKEKGKNNYQFYNTALHVKSFERMTLERELYQALEHNEFEVYYQPQVDISAGNLVGMEALVRWKHPNRGLISPDQFLGLAEDTRLIIAIDKLVLHSVCLQIKSWQERGLQDLSVAVNLSVHTFHENDLVATVTSILKTTGLDPHLLMLEITESVAMQSLDTIIHKLKKLCDLGIQIAIDDFGTGFSSLYYLKKFPVNKIKISQQFVRDIVTDQNDKAIVSLVIDLAQSLKLKVIAEGVETQEQLKFLKQKRCDEIQGYLYCKPLSTEEFNAVRLQKLQLPNLAAPCL